MRATIGNGAIRLPTTCPPNVQTLDADLDLVEAAEAFLASSFRRFPVMSEGRLVGQISRSDLLQALAGNWQ
jgi:CBS domain-containing protein